MFIRKGEQGILGHNSNVMCVHRQDTVTPLWVHHCFLLCPPVLGLNFFFLKHILHYFSESLWVVNSLVFVYKNMIWFYLYYFKKNLFTWLHWLLVVAHGIFAGSCEIFAAHRFSSWGVLAQELCMQALFFKAYGILRQILNHWTNREVPLPILLVDRWRYQILQWQLLSGTTLNSGTTLKIFSSLPFRLLWLRISATNLIFVPLWVICCFSDSS